MKSFAIRTDVPKIAEVSCGLPTGATPKRAPTMNMDNVQPETSKIALLRV